MHGAACTFQIRSRRYLLSACAFIVLFGVQPKRAAADEAAAATVPFAYVKHEIVISAQVDNAGPYLFLLDTDTTPSVIDSTLAKRLGLRATGAAGFGHGQGNGSIRVVPVTIPRVQIGSLAVRRLDALAADVSFLHRLGVPIEGVLGTSFLDRRVVEIDYPSRKLTLLPSAPLRPCTMRFHVDARGNNVSDVWVGTHRATASFDTGDNGFITVGTKGIADLGLQRAAAAGKSKKTFGYRGAANETTGILSGIRFGRLRVPPLPTHFAPSDTDLEDLNVGNRAMEKFDVTFDYQRDQITFAPARPD